MYSPFFPSFQYDQCIICHEKFDKHEYVAIVTIKQYQLSEDVDVNEKNYTKHKYPLHDECMEIALDTLRGSVLIEKERRKLEDASQKE